MVGLGWMLGTVEGSIFYEIGGYVLPFYVNAGLLLIAFPLIYFYLPSNE